MSKEQTGMAAVVASLAALLATLPYRIENQWFSNQEVNLDGYRFVRCRFDNCVLKTSRGTFVIEDCFMADCSVHFLTQAARIVRLYTHIAPQARQEALTGWPELLPEYSPEGTFTIR